MDPKEITPKIPEIVSRLCAGIAPLFPKGSPEPILFGSYARGNAEYGSDLDVMILVDSSRETISERRLQVGDVAGDLLLEYGVLVSPIVENRAFFYDWLPVMPFFQNIQREGVRMNG